MDNFYFLLHSIEQENEGPEMFRAETDSFAFLVAEGMLKNRFFSFHHTTVPEIFIAWLKIRTIYEVGTSE